MDRHAQVTVGRRNMASLLVAQMRQFSEKSGFKMVTRPGKRLQFAMEAMAHWNRWFAY